MNVIDTGTIGTGSSAVSGVDAQGRYIYGAFNPDDQNQIQLSSSLWRIQLGIRYEF